MPTIPEYPDALAQVGEVLEFYSARAAVLPRCLELEDKTRLAARAALHARINLPVLSAELGRLAAESLPARAATDAGRAMAQWAAREYYGALGLDGGEGTS